MQVASSSFHHPVAGSSSRPAASSNRQENDPVSKFDALYQQNALAKLRASVIVKSQLFAMSRVIGTPGPASKKGYQLLAELQQSTHELLKYLSDPSDGTGSGSDKPLLQRITVEAINAARERITTGRATMIDRLRKFLHEVDTACINYMVRDGHTAENFLALHAALTVCIDEFESAVRQRPSGSADNAPLEDLYEQARAAVRQSMPRGELQKWNLQNQWTNAHAALSRESLGNRTEETDAPQVHPDLPLPPVDRENSPRVAAETDALTPAQRFPEVDRILEEMAQGSTKWNSGTRFTAPTKQLRQLKEMLGRGTEGRGAEISERRLLRQYILTRMVRAIDDLPAESAFTYEHRQMVVRLYQRILHHENLPKHDYFSRLKTYRQLRVVEQLDRLAPTPADFQQHLLISDASLVPILTGLLNSTKLHEFRETWIDIAGHQLQRLRQNLSTYTEVLDALSSIQSTAWLPQDIGKYRLLIILEAAWLQTQRRSDTDIGRSEFVNIIDAWLDPYINTYMRNSGLPNIQRTSSDFIESLERTLGELFTVNPWVYLNLLEKIVKIIYERLNQWRPENQDALLNMIFSSMNWHRESQVLNDNAERSQFNDRVNLQLRQFLRRVMSERHVPAGQEAGRNRQRQDILRQLREKLVDLKTSNPEAHAQLLNSFMSGWDNWNYWPADARTALTTMVSNELRWVVSHRSEPTHGYPAFDFLHASEMATENISSLIDQDSSIRQIILSPDYVEGPMPPEYLEGTSQRPTAE
jgi:hypothetical protein